MEALFQVGAADVADTADDWYTPPWLFRAAGLTFDMDVAAPVDPARRTCPARHYLTPVEDGLVAPWEGIVWMNPPFSQPERWVDKFIAHGDGLALTQVMKRSHWRGRLTAAADAIAIIDVQFSKPDGRLYDIPWPLLLTAVGTECVAALARVAAADKYAAGVFHVRPGLALSHAGPPSPRWGRPCVPSAFAETPLLLTAIPHHTWSGGQPSQLAAF